MRLERVPGPCALDEAMFTMRPQPASIMSGTTAWQQSNVPIRFTAITRWKRLRARSRGTSRTARCPRCSPRIVAAPRPIPHLGDRGVDPRPVGDVDGQAERPAARASMSSAAAPAASPSRSKHRDGRALGGQALG